ncbi:MAG TPA: SRPBCC family protein, partial [Candidatus Peribacteria bacterium]|nr:SRPBCC family protein [Candidatus Peribacteria bacterium]
MSATSLALTEHYDAPAAKLFQAWSDPAIIPKWFTASPENTKTMVPEFDFKVGGAFKIDMVMPDGSHNIAAGKFLEIVKDKKISMSWRWLESPMAHNAPYDSVLTITLAAAGGGTDLTLTHEKLADQTDVDNHTGGWQMML